MGIAPEGQKRSWRSIRICCTLNSKEPLANVELNELQLKPKPRHVGVLQGKHAPNHKDFIVNSLKQVEKIGAVYKNQNAHWASAALAVSNPGSDKLHFTVDLRGRNKCTFAVASHMPDLESLWRSMGKVEYLRKFIYDTLTGKYHSTTTPRKLCP